MPHGAHQTHLNHMPIRAEPPIDRSEESPSAAGITPSGESGQARRRFLIIHNPIAGRNRIGLVQDVVRHLEGAGAVADFLSLAEDDAGANGGLATRIKDYDAIVASGGDGTARSIATLLRGHEVPLALIPVGTGNVLAAELDLPRDARTIAHMLLHGRVVRLSTAAVNGAPFLLMIGAGFDGQVIAKLPLALKRRVGRIAFSWPVIVALARKPKLFPATIDGQAHETSWLVVANAARYGGPFTLSPRTNVLAAGFNVVVSRATSRRQRIWELFLLGLGRLEKARTIEMRPARDIEIPDADALPVQVDGEPLAASTFRIVADVAGTSMIVPVARKSEDVL